MFFPSAFVYTQYNLSFGTIHVEGGVVQLFELPCCEGREGVVVNVVAYVIYVVNM